MDQWHCDMVHGWARLSSRKFSGGGVAHSIGSTKTLNGRYCWWTCFLAFFCCQTQYPTIFRISDKKTKSILHILGIHLCIYAFWPCPSTVVLRISSPLNHHHGWWSACPGVHQLHSYALFISLGKVWCVPWFHGRSTSHLLGDCHCQTTFV